MGRIEHAYFLDFFGSACFFSFSFSFRDDV